MVPTLYLFDRFDERLGILPAVGGITHVEEIGGEDTIEFDCAREGLPPSVARPR